MRCRHYGRTACDPGKAARRDDCRMSELAAKAGVTLFATWHSRFALGVEPARQWLADKVIQSISIVWKEDVRRWHPGQAWIWEPGGFGVFDPGINALSILTEIVRRTTYLRSTNAGSGCALRTKPDSRSALRIAVRTAAGAPVTAVFDWRQDGAADLGDRRGGRCRRALLHGDGGAVMEVDGTRTGGRRPLGGEYPRLLRPHGPCLSARAGSTWTCAR